MSRRPRPSESRARPRSLLRPLCATADEYSRGEWVRVADPAERSLFAFARVDEAGWPLVNGVRTKSGVALSLDIVYYTFRSDLVAMAPYVVSQLTALGIQATSRVNDGGDYMDASCANTCGDFDLLMWAQHTLPAGDPNWYLETFFKTSAIQYGAWSAQNFAMYSSTTIDAALATLSQAAVADRLCWPPEAVDAARLNAWAALAPRDSTDSDGGEPAAEAEEEETEFQKFLKSLKK